MKRLYYFCRLWYTNIRHPILRFWYWRERVADTKWKAKEKKQFSELLMDGVDIVDLVKDCQAFEVEVSKDDLILDLQIGTAGIMGATAGKIPNVLI